LNHTVLTNYTEQSPSWEAKSLSTEIHRLLWNRKLHYRVHKGRCEYVQ